MSEIDIFVTLTGNFNISILDHKNISFIGNTGHYDDKIHLTRSEGLEGMRVGSLKPPLRGSRCDRASVRPTAQFGLRHWPSHCWRQMLPLRGSIVHTRFLWFRSPDQHEV